MKRIFLLSILFLFCHLGYSGCILYVYINADGNLIKSGIAPTDFKWSMYNARTKCTVTNNPGDPYCATQAMIAVTDIGTAILLDADEFNPCSPWAVGDEVTFTFTVDNASNPLHGYRGTLTFAIPSNGLFEAEGADGLNMVGAPKPAISILPNPLTICQGAATTAKATVTNVDGAYTVTWSGATGITTSGTNKETATFSTVAAGSYTITASVSGVSATMPLTVKPVPAKPALTQTPNSICAGEDVTLSVGTAPANVTYAWTPTPNTPSTAGTAEFTATTNKNTTYQVTPTLDGCTGPASNAVKLTYRTDLMTGAITYVCDVTKYTATIPINGTTGETYTIYGADGTTPATGAVVTGGKLVISALASGAHTYWIEGSLSCGKKEIKLNNTCNCGATLAISGGATYCEGQTLNKLVITPTISNTNVTKVSFTVKAPDNSIVFSKTDEPKGTGPWDFTPSIAGTYTLSDFKASNAAGTDDCGTITTATTVVTINNKPTVTFAPSKTEGCFGDALTLSATPLPAGSNYSYTWTPSGLGSGATVATTFQKGVTKYAVKVRNTTTNCESDVTPEQNVTGHHSTVVVNGPGSVINGGSAALTSTVTQNPNTDRVTNYEWTGGSVEGGITSGPALSGVTTGKLTGPTTYKLEITDQFGCKFSGTKLINVSGSALAVTATGASGCEGTVISLGAQGTGGNTATTCNYTWKPVGGLILDNVNVQNPKVVSGTPTGTPPGSYTATVVVNDGNNTATSAVVTINVFEKPSVTLGVSPARCVGDELTLTATPADGELPYKAYTWTGAGTSGTASTVKTTVAAGSNDYKVKVQDNNNCWSDFSNLITVVGKPVPPKPVLAQNAPKMICMGESVTLEVTNHAVGVTYVWTPVPGNTTATTATYTPTDKTTLYSVVPTLDACPGTASSNLTVSFKGDIALTKVDYECNITKYNALATIGGVPAGGVLSVYTDGFATVPAPASEYALVGSNQIKFKDQLSGAATHTFYVKSDMTCNTIRIDLQQDCACNASLAMTGGGAFCPGSVGDLTLTLTAGAEFKKWSFILKDPDGTPVLNVSNEATKKTWTYKPLKSGVYTVEGFVADDGAGNVCGSVNGSPATVTIHPKPVVTLEANPKTGSLGSALVLTATVVPTGNYNYTWKGPATAGASGNVVNTTIQAGTNTYSVSVQEQNTTCRSEEVNVTVQEVDWSVTATGGESCVGGEVSLTSTINGSITPGSYLWSSADPRLTFVGATSGAKATVRVPADMPAGNYNITLKVGFNGSDREALAVVKVKGNIAATQNTICMAGDTYNAEITVTGLNGGTPKIYTDAAATQELPGVAVNGNLLTIAGLTTAQTYYIKETPAGCNIVPLSIQKPTCECTASLDVTLSDRTCLLSGTPITITMIATGGQSYSFDLVNKAGDAVLAVRNSVQTQWPYVVDKDKEDTYRIVNFRAVTATSPAGCEGNVVLPEFDVRFFPMPVITVNDNIFSCGTDKVTLTATGQGSQGIEFTWDRGVVNGQPFTPPMNVTTTYKVTARDINTCTATKQVEVTVREKPQVRVAVNPGQICKGDSVYLQATGNADSYTLNNGIPNNSWAKPIITTKYVAEGKKAYTVGLETYECKDTASAVAKVNMKPEIVEKKPSNGIKRAAIGHGAVMSVVAIGENLKYQWQQFDGTDWMDLSDMSTNALSVSGANTPELTLQNIPAGMDGARLKCVVSNECGTTDAEFTLSVTECFDIKVNMVMKEGIIPDVIPGDAVDGWYCIGTKIALQAKITPAEGAEDATIEYPHYKWLIDGLPSDKIVESDSSVLSWTPEDWENDVVIQVCAYSDGACDTICAQWLRLKAKPFADIKIKMHTSIDPERTFCPGEVIDFWVTSKNAGNNVEYSWQNDITNIGKGDRKTLKMNESDTWLKVIMTPSKEVCTNESEIADSVHLTVKEFVTPSVRIDCADTVVCRGDAVLLKADCKNVGANPKFEWWGDTWNLGYKPWAEAIVRNQDMWIKCIVTPSNDVCWNKDTLVLDRLKIRVMENEGSVVITADMTDKAPGDEILFTSKIENIIGVPLYEWRVNEMRAPTQEPEYASDRLVSGDVVYLMVSGERICQTKIRSNEIVVKFGHISRDTLIEIYRNGKISNLDMFKVGDENYTFRIPRNGEATFGHSTINPHGKFDYKPNKNFVGRDEVMYLVENKYDRTKVDTGYIYITVKDGDQYNIPNIITPNGDGLNDTWILGLGDTYPDHLITVFNRNGKPVFQGRNYQDDWNGLGQSHTGYTADFNLPNGIYTYVVDLGDKVILKGWLEIRRNMNRGKYGY